MSKILEVNDLCKSFVVKKRLLGENDVVSAVNHVSLGLEEGEVLGIVGESGCGKSTVARLLLHRPFGRICRWSFRTPTPP